MKKEKKGRNIYINNEEIERERERRRDRGIDRERGGERERTSS